MFVFLCYQKEKKMEKNIKPYRIYTADLKIKFVGTDQSSFFNDLKTAVEKCDFDKGEMIYQYCLINQARLWQICVNKDFLKK